MYMFMFFMRIMTQNPPAAVGECWGAID
jgi:hypothetical protein